MAEDRPPALFLADALGLDFLNSVATPADTKIEWLATGEGLLAWLEQAKLVPPEIAALMPTRTFPGELDAVAAQARALREWFRDFILAHKGRPLEPLAFDSLSPLNHVLERDESYGAIALRAREERRRNDGNEGGSEHQSEFEFGWHRRWRTPDTLLIPIAQAMAGLICSADFTQIKECEGPACTIIFLDTTKGRARRWCSMSACGNRAKQAAHRARSRKAKR